MNLYYTGHLCSASTAPPDRVWRVYKHEEVRASVARLLVVAEKVPHSRKCSIRAPHAATMDYKPTCNCPRGQLLAMLKETTNGN